MIFDRYQYEELKEYTKYLLIVQVVPALIILLISKILVVHNGRIFYSEAKK